MIGQHFLDKLYAEARRQDVSLHTGSFEAYSSLFLHHADLAMIFSIQVCERPSRHGSPR